MTARTRQEEEVEINLAIEGESESDDCDDEYCIKMTRHSDELSFYDGYSEPSGEESEEEDDEMQAF